MTDEVLKRGLRLVNDKLKAVKEEDEKSFADLCIAISELTDLYLHDVGDRVVIIRINEEGDLIITRSVTVVPEKPPARQVKNEILNG